MNRQVVCLTKSRQQSVRGKGHRRSHGGVITKPGQIEHLQSRIDRLTHHHHVVAHHLNVAPQTVGQPRGRQLSYNSGLRRVRHLDHPSAIAFAEQNVFPTVHWIGPPPNVIGVCSPRVFIGDVGNQLHLFARPGVFNPSIDALPLSLNLQSKKTRHPKPNQKQEGRQCEPQDQSMFLQDTNSSSILCVSSNI